MLYLIIVFILLFTAGFLFFNRWLKIAPTGSGRTLKSNIKGQKNLSEKIIAAFVMPFAKPLAHFIKLAPKNRIILSGKLKRVGLQITPELFYARAIAAAALVFGCCLLFALLMGLQQFIALFVLLSVMVYFHLATSLKDSLNKKKVQIEHALPGFMRSVIYRINIDSEIVGVDVIRIFSDYQKVANPVFKYDVDLLLTDMQYSGIPFEVAIRRMADRIGIAEVSYLANILIALQKGENQKNALENLAHDMDVQARETIRKELDKRPGKVRLAEIPLVLVAVSSLLYVIGYHLLNSFGGMF